jgi:hypothetical protein
VGQRGSGTQVPVLWNGREPSPVLVSYVLKGLLERGSAGFAINCFFSKISGSGDWGWMDPTRHLLSQHALRLVAWLGRPWQTISLRTPEYPPSRYEKPRHKVGLIGR